MAFGAAHGPEHAGSFKATADHCLASGFDNARPNEQLLVAELRITHSRGIAFEVISLHAELVCQQWIGTFRAAQIAHELLDFADIELALPGFHPALLPGLLIRI